MALDVLSESQIKRIGILSPRAVSQMLHEHLQGKANHKDTLWSCFVFVLWYQHWIERKPDDESNCFSSVGRGRF